MAYVPKLDWKLDDTVTEKDFNRIEGGIKETLDKYKDVETTIHELFTSVSNGKEQVAKAITDQGVSATKEDAFKDLATKIRSIDNGNIPIYVQPTEPPKKTGFWIQDEQNEIEHVVHTDVFSDSGEWTSGVDMPTARDELTSSAVGDKIYAIGGNSGGNSLSKLEIYDTATNTWTSGKDMPTARSGLTSSAVGDRIYVIGGHCNYYLNKLEIYDTTTNTWTIGANMPTGRNSLTSSTVGDKIYAIGGHSNDAFNQHKLEIYDTTTNTWTAGADMPTERNSLASSTVGDKIYVIGGWNGGRLSRLEIYDTTTNTWTLGAKMPTERYLLTSSAVGDKIYAIGGRGGYNNDYSLNELEIYDTSTNTWAIGA
ncbi:kelch repeat-containing protein, partial [Paenibacillus larvae]